MSILEFYHHYNVFVESFKQKSNILHHVCVNEAHEDSLSFEVILCVSITGTVTKCKHIDVCINM